MDDADLDNCFPDELINQIVEGMNINVDGGDDKTMMADMLEADRSILREAVLGQGNAKPERKINKDEAVTTLAHCSLVGELVPRDLASVDQQLTEQWPEGAQDVTEDQLLDFSMKIVRSNSLIKNTRPEENKS